MPARRQLARAFLVLTAALALCLASLAAWLDSPGAGAARLAVIAAGGGAALAGLGLLLTRGDPGEPLRSAAKTLGVLLGLVSAFTALFLWAASTAGGGE
jgi:hypothetical protein